MCYKNQPSFREAYRIRLGMLQLFAHFAFSAFDCSAAIVQQNKLNEFQI